MTDQKSKTLVMLEGSEKIDGKLLIVRAWRGPGHLRAAVFYNGDEIFRGPLEPEKHHSGDVCMAGGHCGPHALLSLYWNTNTNHSLPVGIAAYVSHSYFGTNVPLSVVDHYDRWMTNEEKRDRADAQARRMHEALRQGTTWSLDGIERCIEDNGDLTLSVTLDAGTWEVDTFERGASYD